MVLQTDILAILQAYVQFEVWCLQVRMCHLFESYIFIC